MLKSLNKLCPLEAFKKFIPGHNEDLIGVAFASGNYSYNKILADYSAGR